MDAIKIKDLTVSYDLKPVLWDIDLNIKKGSLMAIVGPNGAGKSTLIKALLGIVKLVTGSVLFFDKEYKDIRKKFLMFRKEKVLTGIFQRLFLMLF